MMVYEIFEEWMVGKAVKCRFTGENGVVLDRYKGLCGEHSSVIWVRWDGAGGDKTGVIALKDATFVEENAMREGGATIPWEVGQIVWDVRLGKGIVTDVRTGDLDYPVSVNFDFDGGGSQSYTVEGKIISDDLHRSLYFSEPKIVADTMPPKKPFTLKLKAGDKVVLQASSSPRGEVIEIIREDEDKVHFQYPDGQKGFCSKKHISIRLLGEEVKFD